MYSQCISGKYSLCKELFNSFVHPPHELKAFIFTLNYCLLINTHFQRTHVTQMIRLMQKNQLAYGTLHYITSTSVKTHTLWH